MAETGDVAEHHQQSSGHPGFESLISDLSSRFINLPAELVAREIEDAQRRVCEALEVDLSALWEATAAGEGPLTLTHFHSSQEGLLAPMRGMSAAEYFPWLQQEMLAGRVVAVSSIEDLPAAAALDRENLRLFGVKSNLTVPLLVGGRSNVGALGFNTTRAPRDWPDALVQRLQLVAQVFANALARKRADEALRESEERLSLAADAAEAGLWTFDYNTEVFWATARTRAIFGYSPTEVITMDRFEASVHPDDRDFVREAIARSATNGVFINLEYRIVLPDGSGTRWIDARGRAQVTSTGAPERLMGVVVDISARKSEQEALRASEARLEAGTELAGLAYYEVDFERGVAFMDDRFRALCAVPPDVEDGIRPVEFWLEHLHPEDSPRVVEARRQLHGGELEELFVAYRYLPPGCEQRWIQHIARVAARDAQGRTLRSFGVLLDVTEQKRAEDRLRNLSRRLIGAHEEERALLARELHDDVSQRLAVLAIDAGRAELGAAEAAQADAMQALRDGLISLSEDVHSLAYQLHPSILEELGLVEALRAECERRAHQSLLDVSTDLDALPDAVGSATALCLFRIAQEALTNVARHASATVVSVTLRQLDDGLLLAVADDGVGFDPDCSRGGMRLGLASMRERVRLVDGTLDIESAVGHGTTVVAWAPVEKVST
jgi:PAS domain S-box-containing protein